MISQPDILAAADVVAQLSEEADQFGAEDAIIMLQAVNRLLAIAKSCASNLEAQALVTLEQPILIGNQAWSKKPSMKRRPDLPKIAHRVADVAAYDGNGEVRPAHDAAELAVKLMEKLFVSPSSVPKSGGVSALGYDMDDVTREEHTGFELKVVEL
jgi:hypothetical protein